MKPNNPLRDRSVQLGVAIVLLCRKLRHETKEYAICDQLIRSGTAPGAMISEANDSESQADLTHKLSVALKEARETEYWIEILTKSSLVSTEEVSEVSALLNEVSAMLVASRRTLRNRQHSK
jgi:four helix bundle protein